MDISLNGQQHEAPSSFYFYAPPRIRALVPTSGPSIGGTRIELTGTDLVLPTHVRDGLGPTLPTPAFLLNGNLVHVDAFGTDGRLLNLTLPPLPAGSYDLQLSLTGRARDATSTGATVLVWAPIVAPTVDFAFANFNFNVVPAGGESGGESGGGASVDGSGASTQQSGSIVPAGGPIRGGTVIRMVTPTLPTGLDACCVFGNPTNPCVAATIERDVTPATNYVRCPAPASATAGSVQVGLSLNTGVDVNPVGAYVYTDVLLAALTPTRAETTGGTNLTISGSGFLAMGISTAVARCRFTYEMAQPLAGGGQSMSADVPLVALTDAAAECAPLPTCGCLDDTAGCSLSVHLVRNGIDVDGPQTLSCFAPLNVGVVTPSAGPVGGGTAITIAGGPFADEGTTAAAHCRIGTGKFAVTIAATATPGGVLCAPTPPLHPSAFTTSYAQAVRLSLNAQDYSPSEVMAPTFRYYETPYIQAITPRAGPVDGGTVLTITGLRLNAGGWATTSSIDVHIGRDGGAEPPSMNITSIDEGGNGRQLLTTATMRAPSACMALCCTLNANGVSPRACDAEAMDDAAAANSACAVCARPVGLALNRVNFDWPHPAVPFFFYDPRHLALTSAFPRSGPASGGTEVTLYGEALSPAGAYGANATCGFRSADHPIVRVSVTRADPDGHWVVCGRTLPFDLPTLAAGGHGPPYTLNVSLAPNGVNFEEGNKTLAFYVYPEPTPSYMLPSGGPLVGGTSVLVSGMGLVPGAHTDATLARCRYGRRASESDFVNPVVNVTDVDAAGVRCAPNPSVEPYSHGGVYGIGVDKGVQVALNGQQYAPAAPGLAYRYYVQPQLSAIWPTGGPTTGGSPVTLYGHGFDRFDHAGSGLVATTEAAAEGDGAPLCLFGGKCYDSHDVHRGLKCTQPPRVVAPRPPLAAPAISVNETMIVCVAPAVEPLPPRNERARTSVRVAVALNAQNFVHVRTPLFVYYSGVTARDVAPPFGPPLGGIEVRVGGTHLNVFGATRDARCRFSEWHPLLSGATIGMGAWLSKVIDVAPTHKDEHHLVCRTPRFPAGTARVQLSLNGRDFHGDVENGLLTHRFECEQHRPDDMHACIRDLSCGHCADGYQRDGLDYSEFGLVPHERHGCAQCHPEGCAAGPANGTCRMWTFDVPILVPSADAAQARVLQLANVSEPFNVGEGATAHGWLLPDQMRYFRMRAPHASARLLLTVIGTQGALRVVARRGLPPGANYDEYDLESSRAASPYIIEIPPEMIDCVPGATPTSPPVCDEWVVGVLGQGYVDKHFGDISPQTKLSDFSLTVRVEIEARSFDCDECGHDCSQCGWAAGHSAQFVADNVGRPVVRLTNDTYQMGTLWARQAQPYSGGFEATFSFRISEPSVCTLPLEVFGTVEVASTSGREFVPMAELEAAGEELSHYLTDHPDLPFEQMEPPRGLPPQLRDAVPSLRVTPGTRYGTHTRTRDGAFNAPYMGQELRCPTDAGRVGGEGLAFVLQSVGVQAAGCIGRGVGYASTTTSECPTGGIPNSIAIQFDTHHHARTVNRTTCIAMNQATQECKPGATKVTTSLEWERKHSVAIFTNGVNAPQTAALGLVYLSRIKPTRLDDGEVHEVLVAYQPPTAAGNASEGRLTITFDRLSHPALIIPITLPLVVDGQELPGRVEGWAGTAENGTVVDFFAGAQRAYVGFTASTGEASEKHDILSARFCHKAGCAAI